MGDIKFSNINSYINDPTFDVYSSEGWLQRKVTALPKAAWCGLVLPINHLARAIFSSPFNPKPSQYFKAHVFSAVRDVQESFGHVIAFFRDELGQNIVHKAQAEKKAYRQILFPTKLAKAIEEITKDGIEKKEIMEILSKLDEEEILDLKETLKQCHKDQFKILKEYLPETVEDDYDTE